MKSQSTLSKAMRKSKEITARCLLSILESSLQTLILKSACKIVLSNWFSPTIIPKVFAFDF